MSTSMKSALLSAASLLTLAACAPEPCSVTDNSDGTYTLSCPDGTSVTVQDGVDGANGSDGTNGSDGADGADGADGSDGASFLVDVADEPAGENCENGGVVITWGDDSDGSGTLDSAEIVGTEYVCDGLDGYAMSDVEFPSEDSTKYNTSSTTVLGEGGGGSVYIAGSYVEETFTLTDFSSVNMLQYSIEMYDSTNTYCTVGTLNFVISVNGTEVGSYSFEGGGVGDMEFSDTLIFSEVSGAGSSGEDYTLRIESQETVCSGGGSYNWYAGGTVLLGG